MQFMPNRDQADPHTLVLAREDLKFASEPKPNAREDHARADDQQASVAHTPAPDAMDPRIASFRPAALDDIGRLGGPIRGSGPAVRGAIGFAVGGCIVLAAIAWQSSYGVTARGMIESWAPQLASRSSPPPTAAAAVDEPNSPGADVATAQSASPEPAAAAQTAAPEAAPLAAAVPAPAEQAVAPAPVEQAAASAPADQTQLLQKMTSDLARLEQEIEQLKTSQAQMARDNAATAEQLKTAQEKMARVSARPPEQHLAKMPATPRRPAAAPAPIRKPAPTLTSPQAQFQAPAQPQAMAQGQQMMPRPAGEQQVPVGLRPPMPVP